MADGGAGRRTRRVVLAVAGVVAAIVAVGGLQGARAGHRRHHRPDHPARQVPTTWPCRTCGRSAERFARPGGPRAAAAPVGAGGARGHVVHVPRRDGRLRRRAWCVGLAARRADAAVPHRRAQPAAVRDRRPRPCRSWRWPRWWSVGAASSRCSGGSGSRGCRWRSSPRTWPSSRSPSARCAGCSHRRAASEELMESYAAAPLADAAGHALPGGRAVPRAGAQAGRGRGGGRSDRGRDLHRDAAAASAA